MNQQVSQTPFRWQLERLFVYYSSFGDKDNCTLLKLQNYRRLLTDLQLLTPDKTPSNLPSKCDLIFYAKATPAGVVLPAFLGLLTSVAGLIIAEEDAFGKLMRRHMQPLHDYIMAETEFGHSLVAVTPLVFKEDRYALLTKFQETLRKIYGHYFALGSKQGEGEELRMFVKLSKDLCFMPRIIGRPAAQIAFRLLVNRNAKIAFRPNTTKDGNFSFDFGCFIDYLIVLGEMFPSQGDENGPEKLYRLLQGMQVSSGYQKISQQTRLQHFFTPLQELQQEITQRDQKGNQGQGSPLKASRRSQRLIETPMKKQLGEYYEPLKGKFVELCSKKRAQSNFYLSAGTALKMLAQICPKLPQSVCKGLLAAVGRLSFQKFVALLDVAAEKVRIVRERLYDDAIGYAEGMGLGLVLENMHLEGEDQEKCRQLLSLTRSYLRGVYEFYQFGGSLSLTGFLKLLHETQLIPTILGEIEASSLYEACRKNSTLFFEQFQQIFLKIVVSVRFQKELEGVERLLHILEIVCGSKRGEALMKKNALMVKEHPLYKVRLVFGDSYRRMEQKFSQKIEQ